MSGSKGARVHQNAECTVEWLPTSSWDTPDAHNITYTMNHKCVAMAMAADLHEGFGPLPTNEDDKTREHQRRLQAVFDIVSHAYPKFCDDPEEEHPTPADFRPEQRATLEQDWA